MCMCWRDVLCSKGSDVAKVNGLDNMVMLGSLHLTSIFVRIHTDLYSKGGKFKGLAGVSISRTRGHTQLGFIRLYGHMFLSLIGYLLKLYIDRLALH